MFGRQKPIEELELDGAIHRLLIEMDSLDADSEAYAQRMAMVERLSEVRGKNRKKRISPDTVVNAGSNLGLGLLIVAYEQKHVLASKAMSLISKSR